MTKGEVLYHYGITRISGVNPDEEADDDFIGFIAYLVENIFHEGKDS